MPRTKTYQEGGQDERDAMRARLKRVIKKFKNFLPLQYSTEVVAQLEREIAWLDGRVLRFTKRPGGFQGKKK